MNSKEINLQDAFKHWRTFKNVVYLDSLTWTSNKLVLSKFWLRLPVTWMIDFRLTESEQVMNVAILQLLNFI